MASIFGTIFIEKLFQKSSVVSVNLQPNSDNSNGYSTDEVRGVRPSLLPKMTLLRLNITQQVSNNWRVNLGEIRKSDRCEKAAKEQIPKAENRWFYYPLQQRCLHSIGTPSFTELS
ncbi:hypothetical protein E1162_02840 [Rhodobacteraceae bacterium RKSG542]|uniref:hypothetical protein n=1 Tax=Pseudovibrio flavus TaxID=2529854 RepID=UPI0012BBB8CF|nr:hypothetical protein [Pseudovibrio flavus]MTI16171.1 hypothetical protein [Pseudovibrio flavus]